MRHGQTLGEGLPALARISLLEQPYHVGRDARVRARFESRGDSPLVLFVLEALNERHGAAFACLGGSSAIKVFRSAEKG